MEAALFTPVSGIVAPLPLSVSPTDRAHYRLRSILIGKGFGWSNTFTADAAARTITIKMAIRDCGFDCHWYGYVHRAANIRIDDNLQNYFGSSTGEAIAYLTNAVALSGGCSGIVPDVSKTIGVSFNDHGCGAAQPTALQQGAVFSEVWFDTGGTHNSVMTFTYKLF
jgi:hypothetical protein